MATILRTTRGDVVVPSTCENPQFPSWMWRYNRNQHLSRYDPWLIRDERMPPNYRNMGVHSNFRFHPKSAHEITGPLQTLGVNYCHDANKDRIAGFGNSAIGRTPGPAPPRLFSYIQYPYILGDTYKVNEIHDISRGFSLINKTPLAMNEEDEDMLPLNPSHYLEKTLGQTVQIPGTFPHFNKALPSMANNPPRECSHSRDGPRDLMAIWKRNYDAQLAGHAREGRKCCTRRSAPCLGLNNGK